MMIALGCSAIASAQSKDKPSTPAESSKVDSIIEDLVEGHNQERAKEKLPPLKLEARLTEAARVQARDMADRQKMGHEGSDGSTPEQRVVNAGYHYLKTGENVAVGYRDVEEVIQAWMDSPGHRKNIMGEFTEIGLACVIGKDKKPYWAADFGTPMPKFDPANASKDLVKRINEERATAKLAALTIDDKLAKAAQEQAVKLAKSKSQGGGTASFDGIDQKPYSDLAMTTANGHPDAPTMVKVILENPDMKAQLLGKFSRIGAGYATAENGIPYWCLILANPVRR